MVHHSDPRVFYGRFETVFDARILIDVVNYRPSLLRPALENGIETPSRNHAIIQLDSPGYEPDEKKWQYQQKNAYIEVYRPKAGDVPTLRVAKLEGFVIEAYEYINIWEDGEKAERRQAELRSKKKPSSKSTR